jgi:hypothetical protein
MITHSTRQRISRHRAKHHLRLEPLIFTQRCISDSMSSLGGDTRFLPLLWQSFLKATPKKKQAGFEIVGFSCQCSVLVRSGICVF